MGGTKRSPTGLRLYIAVDRRVEGGVVVHLQLAVKFEAPGAGQSLAPQHVEAAGKVGALLGEDGEALAVAFTVLQRSIAPFGLFTGVIDLQREDGKPVDDQARRLGVQRRLLCRQPLRREPIEQGAVEFFGEVVAELVGAVDAALYVGELRIGGAGCAGFVFDVPEVEVGVVLAGDAAEPGVSRTESSPEAGRACQAAVVSSWSFTIASAESIGLLAVW